MKDWISTAKEYEKYKQQKRGSNAMSEENLLSRWGQGYDHAHRGEDGYISLSQRWKDLYQRVVDYYNDEESYSELPEEFTVSPSEKCVTQEDLQKFRQQIADPEFEGYCHCMLYYKSKD